MRHSTMLSLCVRSFTRSLAFFFLLLTSAPHLQKTLSLYSDNILHLFTWAQSIRFAISYFHFEREFFFLPKAFVFSVVLVFFFLVFWRIKLSRKQHSQAQIQIDTNRNVEKKICRNSFLFVPFCVLVLSKIEKRRKKKANRDGKSLFIEKSPLLSFPWWTDVR